jgi:hypothetical protein
MSESINILRGHSLADLAEAGGCLLYASPSPIDYSQVPSVEGGFKTEEGLLVDSGLESPVISDQPALISNTLLVFPPPESFNRISGVHINQGDTEELITASYPGTP